MTDAPKASRVGYARVSTADQDAALQVDELESAGCGRIFVDTASGALRDRPQLSAALDYVRSGDVLVVWRLDRLGRSLRHLIDTVEDLNGRGVGLVSLREAIDTTTPSGRLVLHIFGSLAEFERELIIERTTAGLAAARLRGRLTGRPSKVTPAQLRTARAMYASGDHTAGEIAAALGVSRATLYRHLKPTQRQPGQSGSPASTNA